MRIFEGPEVEGLLPMKDCIELMRTTLGAFAAGRCIQPPRSVLRLPEGDLFGFMPAYLGDEGYFGAKLVTAFHRNLEAGLPSHRGYVLVFEALHGGLEAMVDAGSVTRIRTGAVSAVATDLLARRDARVLGLIGAGAQARSHLEAIGIVRDIELVKAYDIDPDRARAFARDMRGAGGAGAPAIAVVDSAALAASEADVVCTLTTSADPVLRLEDLKPGAHVNAVGAFTPDKRELTAELVAAAALYADQVDAMKRECGDFLIAAREGAVDESRIRGAIGDLVLGRIQGRRSDREITVFDALGLAVEDLACAVRVMGAAGGS